MKRYFVFLMVIMLPVAGINVVLAQDRGTSSDAKNLLKRGVAYVKVVGKDSALVEFGKPKGHFIYKDIYVFASDDKGLALAHPVTPVLVGQNMMKLKDADGKMFIKQAIELVKKNISGTIDYRWTHPQTKKVEKKETYVEWVNGIVLYCGYYK
jgi:hypothetical protein